MTRQRSAMYGFHLGKVVDNDDDKKLGRLQVEVPAVLPGVLQWATPCVPFAGPGRGFRVLPHNEDLVWVTYEAGDVTRPIWVGSMWGDEGLPAADTPPSIAVLRTAKASIRIDDDSGEIVIENEGGAKITLSSSEITITAGTVKVEASGRTIDLTASSVSINSGGLEVS